MIRIKTQCCIVGGGPAGMMLGLLLARSGIDVVVLEKHADFLRDFRGDTIHPSTLQVMSELGMLDRILQRPHQKVVTLHAHIAGEKVTVADFSHLPGACQYMALMPQWDFLDFIADEARHFAGFHLLMDTDVQRLVTRDGVVTGIQAESTNGSLDVDAELVIGCDGRHSTVRQKADLPLQDLGAPMDVLWMRLPRKETDPAEPQAYFLPGKIFIMLYRDEYWQCGYVIPKGNIDAIHERGLAEFRSHIASIEPFLEDRVDTLTNWEEIKLLTVAVNRLKQWYRPGLLCIGDAAHAMSPIGGVGINLAIQDAVASANILVPAMCGQRLATADLAGIQARRILPTKITQRFQVLVQNRIIRRVIGTSERFTVPIPVKLLDTFPPLRRLPARFIGLGYRPEHIHTPVASD